MRLGCLSGVLLGLGVALGVFALTTPCAFHIGDRVTPLGIWTGAGRLRDSSGAVYGLFVELSPYTRYRRRSSYVSSGRGKLPRNRIRGRAEVCTANGTSYVFDLSGEIEGAWLRTDGADMILNLREKGDAKPLRHFSLYGTWQGRELPLDDHKSMFMYIQPGGSLTPTRSYTSPVPEKHAGVTLSWATNADFQGICRSL